MKEQLPEHFLARQAFCEHHSVYAEHDDGAARVSPQLLEEKSRKLLRPISFKGDKSRCCFSVNYDGSITNGYYIGTDWLQPGELAVYVQAKTDRKSGHNLDFLSMLFSALQDTEVLQYMDDLYEIKWDEPEITLPQQNDMLTPLLIIQFLQVLKVITRKGLRQGYTKRSANLRGKVKGKILVGQNIRQNLARSRPTHTWCAYDEFSADIPENRLLKKALGFVQRYLSGFPDLRHQAALTDLMHYISPAFARVSEDVSLQECRHFRPDPFYKEYALAIALSQKILRRFAYNISRTASTTQSVPPFWIDMSRLFELFVLQKLKARYPGKVHYQYDTGLGVADFILCDKKQPMVIDAKYKLKYREGNFNNSDLWQVSGYARTHRVYNLLGKPNINELIDCLIIHPAGGDDGFDELTRKPIANVKRIYQLGVKLPTL